MNNNCSGQHDVSIIIPVYNNEYQIARCLNSAINQTISHTRYEIIIIDDASTDNSIKIVQFYQKHHSNIHLIKNKLNLRQGLTRNKGIEYSNSKYIYFLDADDYIKPNTLEILLNKAKNRTCIVISPFIKEEYDQISIMKRIAFNPIINFLKMELAFYITGMLISKDIVKNIRFKNILHEDIIFLCDLLNTTKYKILHVFTPLYIYTKNKNSTVNNYSFNAAIDYINSWFYVKDCLVKNKKQFYIWRNTLKSIIDIINMRLADKYTQNDIKLFWKQIKFNKDRFNNGVDMKYDHSNNIFVSIIIVVLNAEKTIEKTLKSILLQKYKNYEIIIIDGKSTDKTLEIINNYKKYLSVIISEKDNGIYDAMNKGIHLAKYEYIMFINSGDTLFDESSLSYLANAAYKSGNDIIVGQTYELDKHSNFLQKRRNCIDNIMLLKGMPVNHNSIIYKRSLHSELGEYDDSLKISADYKFILKAWLNNKTFYEIDNIVLNFMRDGISSSQNELLRQEAQYVRRPYLKFINNNDFNIFYLKFSDITKQSLIDLAKKYLGNDNLFDSAISQLINEKAQIMPKYPINCSKHIVTKQKIAVILGNGPSLRGFDFKKELKDYDTFGMNVAYRYWDKINWYPKYYSCLDLVVGISHQSAIARLIQNAELYGIHKFLLRNNLIEQLGELGNSPRIVNFDKLLQNRSPFFSDACITTGSHTMAWAASMGYMDIILLGIDSNYIEILKESKKIEGNILEITTNITHNPNYFFDDYQQKGDRYNIPNVNPSPKKATHLCSWRSLQPILNNLGVRIVNANMNSKVDAFPKVPFEQAKQYLHKIALQNIENYSRKNYNLKIICYYIAKKFYPIELIYKIISKIKNKIFKIVKQNNFI